MKEPDARRVMSIKEVNESIEQGNLLDLLQERLDGVIDLSLLMGIGRQQGKKLIERLYYILPGFEGRERRKSGCENCGLCYLLVLLCQVLNTPECCDSSEQEEDMDLFDF